MTRQHPLTLLLFFALLTALLFAIPHRLSAASALALDKSDYPQGAKIVVYPATNAAADARFHRVHRSSFEHLNRLDGLGWVQAAVWHFHLGRGSVGQIHIVTFGYAINVFDSAQKAKAAMHDVRLHVKSYRVAHIPALRYVAADVHVSLDFVFFAYGSTEIESYIEYTGAAPANLAHTLHHIFSRQDSHLAHLARVLNTDLHTRPTATPTNTLVPSPTATLTPVPSPTATLTPVLTATSAPTETPSPTATVVPTATPAPTSTPAPTPTATPAGLVLESSTGQPTYAAGDSAVINTRLTYNGDPVADSRIYVTVPFPGHTETCMATTDTAGGASCSVTVPAEAKGLQVNVWVQADTPAGASIFTSASSFTIS